MTGLGDERTWCAARPTPSSVAPAGDATSLPPHIQGAERRSERHARRTTRWGLRVLVVGGLAGAAWLLTGAAAHAADRGDDGPTASLLGSVVDGDVTAPVSGLLTAAAQPLEAVPAHHHKHHVVADILELPQRVLTRPAETVSEVAHDPGRTTVDTAAGGVGTVLREVAGPPRLTGGPASAQQRLTAVTRVAATRPVAERPQQPAVAPVPAARAVAPASPTVVSKALRAVPPNAVLRDGLPARHLKASSATLVRRGIVHRAIAGTATAPEDPPGGDGPAPLQLHLGDVSGTPTSGSGTPTEGGSAAFLPAAIASSTMACHRLPIASDVEVRRYDAEAPTVSPD